VDPTRRSLLRCAAPLVAAFVGAPMLTAQDNRRGSVHPPEPAEQEFDRLPLRGSKVVNRPVPDLHERGQEFASCLEQLFISAAKLREEVGQMQLSQVFSLQVYKEIQMMERLVKHLKSLARS
jgi:hypothetical protein